MRSQRLAGGYRVATVEFVELTDAGGLIPVHGLRDVGMVRTDPRRPSSCGT